MLNATVAWPGGETHVLLDGRCAPRDDCPKGQGFYYRAVLVDGLPAATTPPPSSVGASASALAGARESVDGAAMPTALVSLTVVPRSDERDGSEFSVVTVVAEV